MGAWGARRAVRPGDLGAGQSRAVDAPPGPGPAPGRGTVSASGADVPGDRGVDPGGPVSGLGWFGRAGADRGTVRAVRLHVPAAKVAEQRPSEPPLCLAEN